jgi:hypothetical protein
MTIQTFARSSLFTELLLGRSYSVMQERQARRGSKRESFGAQSRARRRPIKLFCTHFLVNSTPRRTQGIVYV